MKYAYEIISLICWPVLIYITYFISMKLINRFEKNIKAKINNKTNNTSAS